VASFFSAKALRIELTEHPQLFDLAKQVGRYRIASPNNGVPPVVTATHGRSVSEKLRGLLNSGASHCISP
jgi:hypothetical protein